MCYNLIVCGRSRVRSLNVFLDSSQKHFMVRLEIGNYNVRTYPDEHYVVNFIACVRFSLRTKQQNTTLNALNVL